MRFIERLMIAAVLAYAVVSGAQTVDPAGSTAPERQAEAGVDAR